MTLLFMDSLSKNMDNKGYPNIRFVNIADLQGEAVSPINRKSRRKKKKPAEKNQP